MSDELYQKILEAKRKCDDAFDLARRMQHDERVEYDPVVLEKALDDAWVCLMLRTQEVRDGG